jgi:WD40 repeat protein
MRKNLDNPRECKFVAISNESVAYLVVAGALDNSLKIYNAKEMKVKSSLYFHSHVTTCLAYSEDYHFLVCGSRDSRISVW